MLSGRSAIKIKMEMDYGKFDGGELMVIANCLKKNILYIGESYG
jgi:hypothetical protein